MTPAEIGITAMTMRKYGGAFVRKLGEALEVADQCNAQTLAIAFPVYFKRYGPGSEFYANLTSAALTPTTGMETVTYE